MIGKGWAHLNSVQLAVWTGVALVGMFVLSQVARYPTQVLWRFAKTVALGCLFLLAINWVGGYFNYHLPLNPYTALVAGFLGLPGVGALVTLHLWFP
ncbi:pro-sigmaK processing inhibitor BofA [Alicyclobacillaceae bacterium I2511]|nr:pro-sigmaK processing inhibitor BofA [Alicyclobacillaceae bacterium I2511]